ncbi:DUF3179 domain-containing (seleno)protein [Roseobacter sp.]|uniref:DUF3179 domain-containing (seleno)protein n=1 Tax=Roseobacter sp. TaxID=1907202 RepID=UPI0029663526|nr:DUF3179 domain-containing (seleno)protein [Roseobacter sp.]MDW3183868.1 DUF3179 domain-containing (seleno)protein [Roseobacter sp.]
MTLLILYLLALTALVVSLVFIPLILVTAIPLSAVYYHSLIRKPVVWGITLFAVAWQVWMIVQTGVFPWSHAVPLALIGLSLFIIYNLYPSVAFPAVDYPEMSNDPRALPIKDEAQVAIIEHNGITKAYPLDYLIHGHIINDWFGNRLVSLTYCALCRSVIPFDVTEIGPLYVGAMKNGNMVLADRNTGTFFQQGTFESVIGPLHPLTLEMVMFQFLTWKQVKELDDMPLMPHVTEHDFRPFALPIPGAWEKLTKGDLTPGLSSAKRDKSFPARTSIIGITDPSVSPQIVFIKDEVLEKGVVHNYARGLILVAQDRAVNAFKSTVSGTPIDLSLAEGSDLRDAATGTIWDVRGKHKSGPLRSNLEMVMTSDEYWYSWKLFHPRSDLIRL